MARQRDNLVVGIIIGVASFCGGWLLAQKPSNLDSQNDGPAETNNPDQIPEVPFAEYRQDLIIARQKAQENYDKTVLSLAGGALGISLVFVKDIVGGPGNQTTWALVASWFAWALSSTAVLISYFTSEQALRNTLDLLYTGKLNETNSPGGIADRITQITNIAGGAFFVAGVFLMGIFVMNNVR